MNAPYRAQPPVEHRAIADERDAGSMLLMVMLFVAVVAGGVIIAALAPPNPYKCCTCEEGTR